MAYTFFLAQGKEVGKSLVERDKVDLAKSLLAKAGGKIKLPVDTVVSDKMSDDAVTKVVEGNIPADLEGFDIGPKTRELYKAEIAKGQDDHLERPDGRVREEALRRRHAGGGPGRRRGDGARAAPSAIIGGGDSAAADRAARPRPTRSATSAPAAGRRWSSWRTGTSRRWTSWIRPARPARNIDRGRRLTSDDAAKPDSRCRRRR